MRKKIFTSKNYKHYDKIERDMQDFLLLANSENKSKILIYDNEIYENF